MASRDAVNLTESPPDIIAPSGDVLLVVGPKEKRMRVHSLMLRTASTVFNAMLGPHYSEGRDLASESPKDIPLPSDDPEALGIIFNAIHYRMEAIDDPLDPCLVLRVAIMADKYGFIEALKLASRDWLKCETVTEAKKLWQLAMASCWLGNEKGFDESTRALLYRHGGSYVGLGETEEMPPDIAGRFEGLMEERRAQLRLDLLSRLFRLGVLGATYDCSTCHYGKIRGMDYIMCILGRFMRQMSSYTETWTSGVLEPSQVAQVSIETVIRSIDMRRITTTDTKCKDSPHSDPDFGRRLRETTDQFVQDLRGLNLSRVRAGDSHC